MGRKVLVIQNSRAHSEFNGSSRIQRLVEIVPPGEQEAVEICSADVPIPNAANLF